MNQLRQGMHPKTGRFQSQQSQPNADASQTKEAQIGPVPMWRLHEIGMLVRFPHLL